MIKHILCPINLEKDVIIALERSVRLAHQLNAKITLLNVHREFMDKSEMEMLRVSATEMMEKFRRIALKAKADMKDLVHNLHADDLEIKYLLHEGKPETVISEVAGELKVDLIVMYTEGKDNIKDYVVGTIAQNVINSAPCPVMVIPYKNMEHTD